MSIRSIFIPTPQIEQYSNYYLVQLLAKERVRCLMTGDKFNDTSVELVEKYLTIPPGITDEGKWFKSEAKAVMDSFKAFEQTPHYQDAMKQLGIYTEHKYEVTSVTVNGLMVLIEIPDASAA